LNSLPWSIWNIHIQQRFVGQSSFEHLSDDSRSIRRSYGKAKGVLTLLRYGHRRRQDSRPY
jgi:hypothetical protein